MLSLYPACGGHKSGVLLASCYLPEACPDLKVPPSSYPASWLASLSRTGISLSVAFKAPSLRPLKSELESVCDKGWSSLHHHFLLEDEQREQPLS